ncbi:MAG: transglutaminase family protein [Hyphomicrobium sp.]|uniref:transglutaminase family protein n=1 Tax=Hyphomicrobium sp. TaxID=82 RepID=UPI00132BB2C0|nr:transglutaminase family protein [Hyphomicrobium sp.]KAB2943212.1 MAG: transglutaminase family protein [Hyphomicrobium sp.]MBZ0210147.1 transglutaminase family protein [Hyphomicrobium sp.]
MIYDVSHRTIYRYSTPVAQSQHIVHMSPRAVERQQIKGHTLLIEPAPTIRAEREDYYGNRVVMFDIEQDHNELVVHARSTIGVTAPGNIDRSATRPWEALARTISDPRRGLELEVVRYACASKNTRATPDIAAYARQSFTPGRPVLAAAWDLVERIHNDFTFDPTATDVSTPVTQVLQQRRGVCQDFSHLALACARAMRLPARYVSGYIMTSPAPGVARLTGADASHAWISVWSPEFGWVDFDPTNGLMPKDEHITIAYGRDYDDVSPISGILLGGNEHSVYVGVDVTPVD